ncbi:MAG: alpha/beta hydrolase [Emcibacter sp.]|nr:alpha/beta hydrolase [Emcibacter sp.]
MLDKQTEKMLSDMSAAGGPALHEMPVADARAALAAISEALGYKDSHISAAEDRQIPGPNGHIPVRIYWPDEAPSDKPIPMVLFFHGGGFALGGIETHDSITRYLCDNAGVIVISVAYRLAPENPFPAGVEDCYAALCWISKNAKELGGDVARIAVAGDSAGGNLAAAVSLMARDRKGPEIKAQLLVYPGLDMTLETSYPSYADFGGGEYFLGLTDMKWMKDMYLGNSEDAKDMKASPLLYSDLSNLPSAVILTAGYDPLCDQGKHYADRLKAAGVQTEYECFSGAIHGFISFAGGLDIGVAGLDRLVRAVKDHLK